MKDINSNIPLQILNLFDKSIDQQEIIEKSVPRYY